MKPERVLALDISSKTGWVSAVSSASGMVLKEYGTLEVIHEPEGSYPSNYVLWAYECFTDILQLMDRYTPDVLVIEETSRGSKNAMSQKILEWIHFLVAQHLRVMDKLRSVYLMTEEWRREIGCKMTDGEKGKNKAVRDYKKAYLKKHGKETTIAYDINGKRIGLSGKKHVNVRRANEIFGDQLKEPLILKDEDLADALGLLACYHFRRLKVGKAKEVSMEDLIGDKL